MQRPFSVILLGTALATPVVHAADIVPIDWSNTGSFERELTVPAGKFAEVCGKLPGPSTVAWAFETDAPTEFNVHYHEGKQVTYPARLTSVTQASGLLQVDATRDYCWMWTNKTGNEARLKLTLKQAR
ncbi:MAG: hypothetical protein JNL93_15630 [Pelomonas sp.]|nr:hypothetical protein [Roseateles sp.]